MLAERARLVDVLAALSLTTDLAFERFFVTFDPGDEALAGAQLESFGSEVGAGGVQTFRIVGVAEQAAIAHATGGLDRARAGGGAPRPRAPRPRAV